VDLWSAMTALANAPQQRLPWPRAAANFRSTEAEARETFQQLNSWVTDHGGPRLIDSTDTGCQLQAQRYVYLHPTTAIPHVQKLLLGLLAEHPGARASELERLLDIPRRTLVRHLASLRDAGFVRLIGGGRESCYALV
jgi:hypothetical protein